jgi:hypothetical protein
MNLIFTIFSIAYIFCIFFWADSPVVSDMATYNPSSLLHIPLYGILTVFLTFAIVPCSFGRMNVLPDSRGYAVLRLRMDASSRLRFLIPGWIALGVAIADEVYQSFLPCRDASLTDVLLDFIGITFALLLIFRLYKRQKNE